MDGTARIVIIGNGFDLHYNIASSYRHYKEWLTIVHPELWQKLERYINANASGGTILRGIWPSLIFGK